ACRSPAPAPGSARPWSSTALSNRWNWRLPYKQKQTYEDFVGERALERRGKKAWRGEVETVVAKLAAALRADYVVLGGGNVKWLKELPPGTQLGSHDNALTDGFRLWAAREAASEGGRPRARLRGALSAR